MQITPLILGSGMAGQAIAKAIHILNITEPETFSFLPQRFLKRDEVLTEVIKETTHPLLLLANPPGLHAEVIQRASNLPLVGIMTEKPVATTLAQVQLLNETKTKVAVFHVYRQMWGPQTIRSLMLQQELGEIISIESRYWQPSVAHRAIYPDAGARNTGWKNDIKFSGPTDVLLDLGTHWIDLITYLMGEMPASSEGWISYVNSEAPHRDTHLHLTLDYSSGTRAIGSISKTVHGATNGLEINILGSKKSASWNFMLPDEITIGEGRDRRTITRKSSQAGGGQAPFHGLGWLEGYVEILRQYLYQQKGLTHSPYPELKEACKLTELLLTTNIKGLRKI